MSVFWGVVGFAIGFNMAVAFAWWTLRRENRKMANHLRIINNPNLTGVHDLKMTLRRPW
jgi:cbb3-type cytochrome oxidase subunit 1